MITIIKLEGGDGKLTEEDKGELVRLLIEEWGYTDVVIREQD